VISFLNPLVLLGLVAAAIPFIIHFLSRLRARRRDFSSLLLLREVQSRNVRRLKTRQWLLLILRTLLIILLVLAPARPAVKGFFKPGPQEHLPTSAVFVLDVSASIGFVDERGPAIGFLKRRMESILSWMNPADRFRLITASDHFLLNDGAWHSPGEGAPDIFSFRFESLEPEYRGTRLGPALEAASRLLASATETVNREVYIFTDLQRGFLGSDSLDLETGAGIRWYLVQAHAGSPENLAVQSVGLPGELVRPGAPLKVSVTVAHYGGKDAARLFPRLYLDGRLVGQGETLLAPNEEGAVVIELPPVEPGVHELTAAVDADGLAADNSRSVPLKVPPRTKVVLIESRKIVPDYLGSALETLSSGPAAPIALTRRGDLPVSGSDIEKADLFILHGVSFPERDLLLFLNEAFGARETPVLILPDAGTPDEAPEIRRFNTLVTRLGLPFSLGSASHLGPGGYDTPAVPQAAAPAGAVFAQTFESIPGLERLKLFTFRRLPPAGSGEAAAGSWDLEAAGGAAILRTVRRGGKKAAIAASDLAHPDECELPQTPLFVPLLHELIALLVDQGPIVKPNLKVGEEAVIQFDREVNTSKMEIHGPGEQRFMPVPGEYQEIRMSETEMPGTYRIFESGRFLGSFCVGLDQEEANLTLEDKAVIEDRFGEQELEFIPAEASLEKLAFIVRGGVEIWPYLLFAALGLLIVEQVVANKKEEGD